MEAPSLSLPRSIDEVDAAWMTAALQQKGVLAEDEKVVSVSSEPFAVGMGLLSLIYRSTLAYESPNGTPPEGAPRSVIIKFDSDIEAQRAIADVLLFYQREMRFYEEVAPQIDLRTATVYASVMAEDSTDFCLVMEDLSGCQAIDQITGASFEQSLTALTELAGFHAHFWDTDLTGLADTFLPFDNPIYRMSLGDVFNGGWGACKQHASDLLPPEIVAFGDRFADLVTFFIDQLGQTNTLIHGDFRADNLMIGDDGELIVIDFQIVGIGRGGYDVGYYLSQSVDTEVRRSGQQELIDAYFAALADGGASADREAEERIIRMSIAWCLIYAVASFSSWDELPEQSRELMRKMLPRCVDAIVDNDCLSLIPPA